MATENQLLSKTPSEIKHGTSPLTPDFWYTIQNRSNLTLYIQTATAAPSNTLKAFVMGPNEVMQIKRTGSNEKVYAWQSDSSGSNNYGILIVDSAT